MKIKFPYGTTEENNRLLLPEGMLSIDLEKKALRLHDGVTQGGFEMVGEQAYFPLPEYITVEVAGDIGVSTPSGSRYAYSQDKVTWTELTGGALRTVPASPGLLYLKPTTSFLPNTYFRIGYHGTQGHELTNNLLGVVSWWNHDVNLRLGYGSTHNFYVPSEAPPNQTIMNSMFQNARAFNQDISGWDVSKVTNMNNMFREAQAFDQDLSSWYVPLIAAKPGSFDQGATAWVTSGRQPQWGVSPP